MTLKEYQTKALESRFYSEDSLSAVVYCALAINGEAGEIAEKVKKIIRDNSSIITDTHVYDIAKEIGDVLWYCTALADELGLSLEEIAQINLEKLTDRKSRNAMEGSGDNR